MRFIHQRGPKFSWTHERKGQARRLAILDRFCTPAHSKLDINQRTYFTHGYSVGSDHTPVQIKLSIGDGEVRRATFKWNVTSLKGEFVD